MTFLGWLLIWAIFSTTIAATVIRIVGVSRLARWLRLPNLDD